MKSIVKAALVSSLLLANSAFAVTFDREAMAKFIESTHIARNIGPAGDKLSGLTRLGALEDCNGLGGVVAGEDYLLFAKDGSYLFRQKEALKNIDIEGRLVAGVDSSEIGLDLHVGELVQIVDLATQEVCTFEQQERR